MKRLDGKVAIVTGAGRGIGAVYAKALASQGANVCLGDIEDCATVVAEIVSAGGKAIGKRVDVADSLAVAQMADAAIDEFGTIDILVNNAALFATLSLKPFEQISSDEFDRVMSVNVRGCFECIKAVSPQMRSQGRGKIVNIASGTFFKGSPFMAHYVASKGAVIGLTRSLARELGQHNIQVNCLAPGLIMSEGVRANRDYSGAVVENNIASRSLKREAMPDDLIGALLFLASSESDFMTGQTIVIDGGSVMH